MKQVSAIAPQTPIEQVEQLTSRVTQLQDAVVCRDNMIEVLNEKIKLLQGQRFGASSEQVSDAQVPLFNEAEQALHNAPDEERQAPLIEVPAHPRRVGKRKPIDPRWPRICVSHDLSDTDKVCPHDGTALKLIGTVDSEQVDLIPATIQVLVHQRHKYACPCCKKHVVTAPMPPQPIPKSQASPGTLAHVSTAKIVDAIPLYRQTKQLQRIGFDCSLTTLARWMIACGQLSQPLINLLNDELVSQDYVQMDETRTQVLKEPGKSAESQSYMWVRRSGCTQQPIVLFDYDPTRSGDVPKRLLDGFSGTLQTDAYSGYNGVVKDQSLRHVLCMAHARRYFTDALKAKGINPKRLPVKVAKGTQPILKALGFIKTLYAIERRIKEKPPDERVAVRQSESREVLTRFKTWVDRTRPRILSSSKLGEALTYLVNNWDGLIAYCDDGRLHIDNNLVENEIRPFAVGRKNYLFSDSVAGAKASANLYSLVTTAKANGLDPYAYLRLIFTELPKAQAVEDIEALLPFNLNPNTLNRYSSVSQ